MSGESFMEALKYKLEDGGLNSVANLISLFIFNFIYSIFLIFKWLFSTLFELIILKNKD